MNKENLKTQNYKEEVAGLIAEVKKTHRYSVSRIYKLYNQVFDKNEVPQICNSCLKRKVQELDRWLTDQNEIELDKNKQRKGKRSSQKKSQQIDG